MDPGEYLAAIPECSSEGSFEELAIFLQHGYPAWWQHDGAIELLVSARLIARLDSEDEIEDMMDGMTFKTNPGSDRTAEELLDNVSHNRIWGYFGDAVEDAMSLAVDRPSDVKRVEIRARSAAALAEEYEEDDEDDEDVDFGSDSA